MKTIKLALFRLFRYFKENRLIFVLYLLGSVTCVITFVYFYGNMMPSKHADARNSLLFRRYEVQLSEPLQLGTNDFAFLKGDPVEDINLETPLLKELPGKSDNILVERGDGDYFIIQSYLYENTKIYTERGRTEFREEERNNGANVVMVPSGALRMFAGGKRAHSMKPSAWQRLTRALSFHTAPMKSRGTPPKRSLSPQAGCSAFAKAMT